MIVSVILGFVPLRGVLFFIFRLFRLQVFKTCKNLMPWSLFNVIYVVENEQVTEII